MSLASRRARAAARTLALAGAAPDGTRLLLFDPPAVPGELLELAPDREPKYGVAPEDAAGGSPDVAWFLAGEGGEGHFYSAEDRLPFGIDACPGREHDDLVLWIGSRRAVLPGDTLAGRGLEIRAEWLPKSVTREQVAERLRPLLGLPVEIVLPTHGAPTGRSALRRALA